MVPWYYNDERENHMLTFDEGMAEVEALAASYEADGLEVGDDEYHDLAMSVATMVRDDERADFVQMWS